MATFKSMCQAPALPKGSQRPTKGTLGKGPASPVQSGDVRGSNAPAATHKGVSPTTKTGVKYGAGVASHDEATRFARKTAVMPAGPQPVQQGVVNQVPLPDGVQVPGVNDQVE